MITFEPPYIVIFIFLSLILAVGIGIGGLLAEVMAAEKNEPKGADWFLLIVPSMVGVFLILFMNAQIRQMVG